MLYFQLHRPPHSCLAPLPQAPISLVIVHPRLRLAIQLAHRREVPALSLPESLARRGAIQRVVRTFEWRGAAESHPHAHHAADETGVGALEIGGNQARVDRVGRDACQVIGSVTWDDCWAGERCGLPLEA